eukprot:evm.model.scf_1698EXC.2 EVM.evm.TU.scf_1698EXC.2   scf_1698EXC:27149-28422(+)
MSKPVSNKTLAQIARVIHGSSALVITAGAGLGVDSGLPDFRGPQGFHAAYPPIAKLGLSFPDVSTPRWFAQDPAFAWGFFGHRLGLYRAASPHAGYGILLEWARRRPDGFFVFTSNVDGHFRRAGFPQERIMERHGDINFLQCADPARCSGRGDVDELIWPADDLEVEVDEGTFRASRPLPACRHCGGLARPNVLMFDDYQWLEDRTAAQDERYRAFASRLRRSGKPFAVIEVGAGESVPTVRWESERLVDGTRGGTLIRINPRDHGVPIAGDHHEVPLGGLEALTALERHMEGLAGTGRGEDVGQARGDLEGEARALRDDVI